MVTGNMLGGGAVVALAAGLWLIYLIPTWMRRREYMATERNVVKLQQTLRILAESAEIPEEIRVEATAREVAEQQRALRKVQQRTIAESKERAAAQARAEAQAAAEQRAREEAAARAEALADAEARAWAEAEARARAAARQAKVDAAVRAARAAGVTSARGSAMARATRRGRLAATAVLLAGLVSVGLGFVFSFALIPFVAAGAIVAIAAIAGLAVLARRSSVSRVRTEQAQRLAGALYDDAVHDEITVDEELELEEAAQAAWTPTPLPRALHLSRGTIAASTMASITAAAELRRAASRAELEERAERIAAQSKPLLPRLRPAAKAASAAAEASRAVAASAVEPVATAPAAPRAVPSRFARMGVLDGVELGALDLDEALRRRRAV